ncbi:hypothetical protein [Arthrobacter sp. H5]|uniref:hypothetical protein n=1 Tax=Arthrobacter sp. H5 TaxID=1267973 RepID=UPI0004BB53DC|nr:hypothetical protein [Arthrobacter sp. H5]
MKKLSATLLLTAFLVAGGGVAANAAEPSKAPGVVSSQKIGNWPDGSQTYLRIGNWPD